MTNEIAWAEPEIGEEELNEVIDTFHSGWLTAGPKVQRFEELMAEYLQVPHAVALTNGTVALDILYKVLGIGVGDEVIVPSMTYMATAAAVCYQCAIPVFVDIESNSWNLDPARIEEAITEKTKAIVFIDYGGNPADIENIKEIASRYHIPLIRDGAQSLGGISNGIPLCGFGALASTISFHSAKVMTCIEGGMVVTHDLGIAEEVRIRRNHGEQGKYFHRYLGTNGRMSDLTAGIGIRQLSKLPEMLSERQRVADLYNESFCQIESITTVECKRKNSRNAWFFYPILVDRRDELASRLSQKGIDTRIAYPMPVYEQEVFQSGREDYVAFSSPEAETFANKVLNLPIFPSLSNGDIEKIVNTVVDFVA